MNQLRDIEKILRAFDKVLEPIYLNMEASEAEDLHIAIAKKTLELFKEVGEQKSKELEGKYIELAEYTQHDRECILSNWEAGRPTKDGYEAKYRGKWYQTRPVDKTPKCECGLNNLLAILTKER